MAADRFGEPPMSAPDFPYWPNPPRAFACEQCCPECFCCRTLDDRLLVNKVDRRGGVLHFCTQCGGYWGHAPR
jgi:hypothetical protein